jgi:hypothetical protein
MGLGWIGDLGLIYGGFFGKIIKIECGTVYVKRGFVLVLISTERRSDIELGCT